MAVPRFRDRSGPPKTKDGLLKMISRTLAAACAMALALPMAASAQHGAPGGGGGGGGGGTPAPTPPPSACTALATDTPAQTINRKARTDLKYRLTNCSASTQVLTLTISSTARTVQPDGSTATCVGPTWTAGTVTLKPRSTQSLTTTAPSSATCALGTTGALWQYAATATDAGGIGVGTVGANVLVTPTF
jgi:hypothetical protein